MIINMINSVIVFDCVFKIRVVVSRIVVLVIDYNVLNKINYKCNNVSDSDITFVNQINSKSKIVIPITTRSIILS